MVRQRKNLGIGLLLIGAFFLFEPTMAGVLDLLPDAIGCLLMMLGLRALADLDDYMESAITMFKRMLIVGTCRFFSAFWLFGFCTPKERPVTTLLIAFVAGVFELIFLTSAFKAMFDGFLYLGSRHGGTAMFGDQQKNATAHIWKVTLVFIIAKAVITALPEFSSLTLSSYDDMSPLRFLYNYISLLRTFAIIILIPIGLFWVISFYRYIRSILRDEPFISALTEKYKADVLPRTDIFLRRAIGAGTIILSIGICFSIDIYIDYISLLPDFLCPIILLIGFALLKPYIGKNIHVPICAAAHMITSAAVFFYSVYFYDHFTMSLALFSEKALLAYYTFCILKVTDSLFFGAMMLSLLPSIRHIIVNYTGFAPLNVANFNSEDKLKQVHGMLNKRVTLISIFSVAAAIGSILYILLVRHADFIWLIEFSLCLTLVIYLIGTLRAICEEVEYKYMLS